MHQAPSWVNSDPSEVAKQLAKKAVMVRELGVEKKANPFSNAISSLGNKFQSLGPEAQTALLGTAAGGGAGLLSSAFSDEKDRDTLGSTLTGALAGGAAGLGAGMVGRQLDFKPSDLVSGGGGSPAPAAPTSWEEYTIGGEKYNIPQSAIAKNPDLVKDIEGLGDESLVGQGVGGAASGTAEFVKNNPTVPAIAAADVGSSMLSRGGLDTTIDPDHLRKGIGAVTDSKGLKAEFGLGKGKNVGPSKTALKELATESTENLRTLLRRARHSPENMNIYQGLTARQIKQIAGAGAGDAGLTGVRSFANLRDRVGDMTSTITGKPRDLSGLRAKDNLMHTSGRGSLLNPFKQRSTIGAQGLKTPGTAGGILGRLALYGGVPAAQYYMTESAKDTARRDTLRKLMEQFAVKE